MEPVSLKFNFNIAVSCKYQFKQLAAASSAQMHENYVVSPPVPSPDMIKLQQLSP